MIDVHTLYLACLVSQATFALTLTLLAWSDRRTKGVIWLAIACAMQFVWTTSRTFGPARSDGVLEAAGGCLLVVLFSMVYMGFRWFVVRQELPSRLWPVLVGVSLLLIVVLSRIDPFLATVLSRFVGLSIGISVVVMLWRPRITALRMPARVCALLLASLMLIMVVRMAANRPIERWAAAGKESLLTIYSREATMIEVTLLSFSFIVLFVKETDRRLQEETRTDSLTGLWNRRAMEEAAMREVGLAIQSKAPLALLMMDLDCFKDLNDTFGHALGDRALRAVGSVLLTATGSEDQTARMGGEEFAVLLPGRSLEEAAEVAERLRVTIGDLRLHETEYSASVTVSIGVSVLRDGEYGWTEMLCRADDALYRAKRQGRNRVEICAIGESPMTPEREAGQRAWRNRVSLPKPGRML